MLAEATARDEWLGVEVRHLATLAAIAEEQSFGAAALSLGYAQSAVSQHIARLEQMLEVRLVRLVRLSNASRLAW
jgi:DNA-binding transcriptional LysR family regulator